MKTRLCRNCKYSTPTEPSLFNPKYDPLFWSWNSEYACLKFATAVVDPVTGDKYYDGVSSCKGNRESYIFFPSRCTPEGKYYESKEYVYIISSIKE